MNLTSEQKAALAAAVGYLNIALTTIEEMPVPDQNSPLALIQKQVTDECVKVIVRLNGVRAGK